MSARPTRAAARRRKEKTMNLYRITYGTPDSETETTNITERSETAARKAFKASCKAFCSIIPDIIGIELIREDVGATKQQERDTLAAIKAELTDAQNRRIEAEASYNSLVDRTTAAEARAEAAEDEIVTLKAKLYDYITAGA